MRPAHDWRHSFRRLHTGSDYLEIYQAIAPIPRIDARPERDGRAQTTPGMRVVIVAKGRDGMPGDAGAILSRCVLLGGGGVATVRIAADHLEQSIGARRGAALQA